MAPLPDKQHALAVARQHFSSSRDAALDVIPRPLRLPLISDLLDRALHAGIIFSFPSEKDFGMRRLTRRQKEFLGKLVALHRSLEEPVHYTALAEHLGVGKIATYEMLRLLEEAGFVIAEYQRPAGARGPGRPTVVFSPTPAAVTLLGEGDLTDHNPKEWERARILILDKVRLAKAEGHEGVLEEMVSLLGNQSSPVEYLTGMVAAIIIGVQSLKSSLGPAAVRSALKSIGLPGERGLSALGGLSIGLSLVQKWNHRVSQAFFDHVNRYQTMLSDLSEENRRRLSQFTSEVIKIVTN
jgi:hypothetical protein